MRMHSLIEMNKNIGGKKGLKKGKIGRRRTVSSSSGVVESVSHLARQGKYVLIHGHRQAERIGNVRITQILNVSFRVTREKQMAPCMSYTKNRAGTQQINVKCIIFGFRLPYDL